MNPEEKKLQHLLDEVVPATGDESWAPDRPAILEMVRRERAQRKRNRVRIAVFGGSATVLVLLLFTGRPKPHQEGSLAETAPPPSSAPAITIHQVDDRELLVLLKDTPAALMEWPDGRRTLLVMER